VLAQVRGRDNHLGLADIVVLEEDDLEQVANLVVVVDDGGDGVDEVDDLLGHPVARRRLAAKNGHARLLLFALLGRERLELQVAVNDAKDVELLALVFVDALNLHVKEGGRVDRDAEGALDVLCEAHLVGVLDLSPLLLEVLVLGPLFELVEVRQILEEAVAVALGGNELRQARVGLVQPAARRDAVGHVGKLVAAKDGDKVLEDGGLDEVRVQFRHAVDLVRADNGEERHAHHLALRLLDDGHAVEQVVVLGEFFLHHLEEKEVDVVDYLQVAREQVLEEPDGPLFERLGQHRVVGVAKLERGTRQKQNEIFWGVSLSLSLSLSLSPSA
jgi:hypothetical protein